MQVDGREMMAFVSMLRFPGLVLVTSPQAAASVKTIADLKGRIAGVMQRRNPSARILADLRGAEGVKQAFGSDTYPASVLYSMGGWVRAHDATARHLAHAIERTLGWMQKHTAEEIADRTPPDFRGEDPALYIEALRHSMPMFSPDGRMAADGAEAVHTLLAGSMPSVRDARIDVSKTYTNGFLIGR
jgi:NitT/TauT family transport system substrate-binding protein